MRTSCLQTLDRLEIGLANGGGDCPRSPGFVLTILAPDASQPGAPNFRELVLKDLGQAAPKYPLETLKSLPDKSLPGFERHFAENAKNAPWPFGQLLVRYGSAGTLPVIRREWDRSHLHWDCQSRTSFLAFFLKVDAATGKRVFEQAMNERVNNGCYLFYPEEFFQLFPALPRR
ncbi:MAG: hypothetical protein U5J83_15860 [Bryobacterales bacterium]|nr:hypothetical protein [Bryobacterales bacterium]